MTSLLVIPSSGGRVGEAVGAGCHTFRPKIVTGRIQTAKILSRSYQSALTASSKGKKQQSKKAFRFWLEQLSGSMKMKGVGDDAPG